MLKEEDDFFKTDTHWRVPTAFGVSTNCRVVTATKYFFDNVSLTTNHKQYEEKKWQKVYLGSHAKRVGTAFFMTKGRCICLIPKFDTSLS